MDRFRATASRALENTRCATMAHLLDEGERCSRRHRKKRSFAREAFERHDVDGILDFSEEGAIRVCEPGRLATGKEAQRGVDENFWHPEAIAKQEKINVAEAGT
jgi:predicted RecB family nuclease